MSRYPGSEADPRVARDLVQGYSLEMTGKDVRGLDEAGDAIPAHTRVNVTFLAAEDERLRLAATVAVKERGFVPVPHIAARRLESREQLERLLSRLREADVLDHVFVVGGDPSVPDGPFSSAFDVIDTGLLRDFGVKEVAIAGYPEGHPSIESADLWNHLEEKSRILREQGLDSVILTQFAFDTDPVMTWIRDVRYRGLDSPIRVGTPGPAGIKRLLGFARRFGVGANAMIVKKYGFSLTNLLGSAGPDRFVGDLAAQLAAESAPGDVKLHFYTFGGLRATADWARDFAFETVDDRRR